MASEVAIENVTAVFVFVIHSDREVACAQFVPSPTNRFNVGSQGGSPLIQIIDAFAVFPRLLFHVKGQYNGVWLGSDATLPLYFDHSHGALLSIYP
jgi:hypothetical protein